MLLVALFAVCLGTAQAQKSSSHQITKPAKKPRVLSAEESGDLLAKAGDLYYLGISDLDSYSCAVHPDWQAVYKASHNGAASAPDDPDIRLLNSVTIVLNKRVGGDEAIIEWSVPTDAENPLDKSSVKFLNAQHEQFEYILNSVLSQWESYVNGEALLDISNGMEITQTDEGYSLRFGTGAGAKHTILNKQLVIQRFTLAGTDGTSIKSLPKFVSTDDGLLVSSFVSYTDRPDASPGDLQKMQIDVEYRTVDGFQLPARFKIIDKNFVKGFDIHLDGCKVIHGQNEGGGGVKAKREEIHPGHLSAESTETYQGLAGMETKRRSDILGGLGLEEESNADEAL
jgi:hypothetical protein